nr:hypothetical protein [Tanacetum cinerariifolium]
ASSVRVAFRAWSQFESVRAWLAVLVRDFVREDYSS